MPDTGRRLWCLAVLSVSTLQLRQLSDCSLDWAAAPRDREHLAHYRRDISQQRPVLRPNEFWELDLVQELSAERLRSDGVLHRRDSVLRLDLVQ